MNDTLPPDPGFSEPPPRGARPDERPAGPLGWERETLERLLFASLREQRLARRWKNFTRLAWLAFFVFLLWALMHRSGPSTDKTTPHTAVIEIKGEIAAGADTSAEAVTAAMKAAF